MGNFIKTQKSFVHGEVGTNFFTNDNLNGLAHMENLDVLPGGGLKRRPGLKKIATLSSNGRLVPFSINENEHFVLVLMNNCIRIFANDTFVQDVLAPWGTSDLPQVQYAQRFGTMIFVHPNHIPKILHRENGVFKLTSFTFTMSNATYNVNMPFMRFEGTESITITMSSVGGNIHFTTNTDFWTADNVNGHLFVNGKTWLVTTYVSATDVIVVCNGAYSLANDPVSDWQEAVFSPRRGWPCSITFHQDRLVFGGAKSWPSGVWMSCVGRHSDFDLGTGLDDEAISLTLLSSRRQHICTLVSSDNLQILTSEGEWAISNKPLTPESVNIKMHTSVGSVADRYLPPQQIEGQTVFVSNNKKDIRELVLDDLGQKYNANNLCALSEHLMQNPVDLAYNKDTKKLFVVMAAGDIAVLNYDSALGISAWGRYTTDGEFCAVVVQDTDTFVITKRGADYQLEKFASAELFDVSNKPFKVEAKSLPLMSNGHNTNRVRLTKIVARVHDTKTLVINAVRAVLPNEIYDADHAGFSGDVTVNILGTNSDFMESLWSVSTTDAMPIEILSITIYGRYQI